MLTTAKVILNIAVVALIVYIVICVIIYTSCLSFVRKVYTDRKETDICIHNGESTPANLHQEAMRIAEPLWTATAVIEILAIIFLFVNY
jgi:Sec-independent protein secretion pathway component TatC